MVNISSNDSESDKSSEADKEEVKLVDETIPQRSSDRFVIQYIPTFTTKDHTVEIQRDKMCDFLQAQPQTPSLQDYGRLYSNV